MRLWQPASEGNGVWQSQSCNTMHRDPRHCGFQKVSTFVWIVERMESAETVKRSQTLWHETKTWIFTHLVVKNTVESMSLLLSFSYNTKQDMYHYRTCKKQNVSRNLIRTAVSINKANRKRKSKSKLGSSKIYNNYFIFSFFGEINQTKENNKRSLASSYPWEGFRPQLAAVPVPNPPTNPVESWPEPLKTPPPIKSVTPWWWWLSEGGW